MMAIPSGDLAGELEAEQTAAHAALDAVLAEALGSEAGVEVEPSLVEGDAAELLAQESENVDLVVVGSHGKSGIRAALLGSVSRHVVDHARCPVVVVKPRTEN
jgi:nucleotide-binding universal stress UspA family protein